MSESSSTIRAMPELRIRLLGAFGLAYDGALPDQTVAARLQALLAYLALRRHDPQPRQALAFLLWPDSTEAQARTNLRQLLHTLKQTLPQADRCVDSHGQTLQMRSAAACRTDVAEFEEALAEASDAEERGDSQSLRAALERATSLYQGDLLPTCYDDWIIPERERLRQAFTGALERLVALLEEAGDGRRAIDCAQRLLRHDPLREETYRDLMRLHASHGDRAALARVYHACEAVLERELGVEPSTATRNAYEQLLKVEVTPQAQARSEPRVMTAAHPPASSTNLPAPLTSFVGREAEMAEVKSLLRATRLLTLTGPGGTGKTRLALEVARTLLNDYPNGVWLIELAPVTDPALVAQTVATTLGVREQPGRTILDALSDYLRARTTLLILDNCEHLIEACARFSDTLLRAAPHLKILASSRETLGIAGETAYRVPPLALPEPDRLHDVAALAQNDCVRLFVDRASTAYPPFRLTEKNALAIAQICLRLDGIPLAIELAAARTRLFPPEQIAARLDDRFRLLTGGSRAALPRHQTLFALIEWSHNLLSEAERVLLRRLSVFAGGWSLEAAQAVCSAGPDDDVLDTLAHLADKSLVVVEEPANLTEGRYHLLETVRQYARDKLLASGESEQVRDRHLDYFLRFAEETEPKLRAAGQLQWLDRLETEHDNLRTALAWALESSKGEHALRLAGALYYFWEFRGYWTEGQVWLDRALALQEPAEGAPAEAGERVPLAASRAKALYAAGRFRFATTLDPVASRTVVEESVLMWRELGNKWWTALALEHVGFMLTTEGDQAASHARLAEGAALAREVGDPWLLAMCLVRLASPLMYIDMDASLRVREEALALARLVGDKSVLCQGLTGLASTYLPGMVGDLDKATRFAEEAAAEARAIGSVTHIFLSYLILVVIASLRGDTKKARGYCREVFALAREKGIMGNALLLFAFALQATFGEEPGLGVRLISALEHLSGQSGLKLLSIGPLSVAGKQALEMARTRLGPEAFEAARLEGHAMTLDQAIALMEENEARDSRLPGPGAG